MNKTMALSALTCLAIWSISSVAAANWDSGACPQPHAGPGPCIETEINGNTYHFNGSGGHAGDWHGLPAAEGGGPFQFEGSSIDLRCGPATPSCNLTLSGEVKKCQTSSGSWRIGLRVSAASFSPGDFVCNFLIMDGFPWYSRVPNAVSHCSFEDNCDGFIPYEPSTSTYVANFGSVGIISPISTWMVDGHLHDVVFNPGVGANFDFSNKMFFDCDEEETGCSIDGILTINNATSLYIY